MKLINLKCEEATKQELDVIAEYHGGLRQRRLIEALVNGWNMLSYEQQREAIHAGADLEPAAAPAPDRADGEPAHSPPHGGPE